MSLQRLRWTPEDVLRLLAADLDERIALVAPHITPPRLAETLIALANVHGGTVVIGATLAGRVAGVSDAAETLAIAQAAGLLATPPLILPLPQAIEVEGKMVCLVEVPPGLPHVYSLGGRYLTRTGSQNRVLSTSELTSLLLERSEAGFGARPAPGATLDDLDPALVQNYVNALGAPIGETWQRLLLARGCLTGSLDRGRSFGSLSGDGLVPTYGGVLLFGREPQRFVPSSGLILLRYAGAEMGDEFARNDARGALPDQIRHAEAFINTHMRRGMRITGLTRQETTEYPLVVVREAIVNAVAHRDYAIRGDGIRILMFSDHMEIYSPGRLPGHVTLDNLLSERFSRNEVVVQVLSDLGFVERLGYGINRMIAAMREAGLPEPVFEETVAGFKVTLVGHGDELVSADPAARWNNRRLNPRQERALAHMADRGSITNREFRDLFPDLSDETIRRELVDLVDLGLIMKVGERKATYYILK